MSVEDKLFYNSSDVGYFKNDDKFYVSVELERFKNLMFHCYTEAKKPESFNLVKEKYADTESYTKAIVEKSQIAQKNLNVLRVLNCLHVPFEKTDFQNLREHPPIKQFDKLIECTTSLINTYSSKQLALAKHRIQKAISNYNQR